MSATLSAQAGSEKTAGPSEPKVDNPAPAQVTTRLRRLAIVHQKAAISRAMRLAGVHGQDKPTLDDLDRAENPPAPQWRRIKPPPPTETEIRAAAEATVRTDAWRMALDKLTSHENQVRAAMLGAAHALFAVWAAAAEHEMTNRDGWEPGQRHAERWRPVLDVLERMLGAVDVRVPDAWLSASSEADLKTAAEVAAQLGLMTTPAGDMDTPAARRARCPMHHRRALRRRAAKARQHLAAMLGTIGAGGAPYADAYAVTCWRERQEAATFFGMNRVLLFEDGTQVPLWSVMEASRRARLAALYVQTLGLDDLAQRRGLVPVFITMTLPPPHHPNPQHGLPYAGMDWESAPSPADTDAALADTWQLFRARLAANDIDLLGLRVVEPHEDGCPHLHALLYPKDEAQAARMDHHLQALCPEPVEGERIASKLVHIDRDKASAASYVMRYLLKCLPVREEAAKHADGTITDGDPDHLAHHDEVQAWASERRLRRFAWLGMHGLRTVWQRVRGMTEDEVAAAPDSVQRAARAMHAGEWGDAMEALGVIRADKAERPRLDYIAKKNGYGEDVKRADGVALGDWRIPLRRRTCRIVKPQPTPRDRTPAPDAGMESNKGFTFTDSSPRAGADGDMDAGGTGRTGPPPRADQAAMPETTPKPQLTNARQTPERESIDRSPAAPARPGIPWACRTTLDELELEAMALCLDNEDLMAA